MEILLQTLEVIFRSLMWVIPDKLERMAIHWLYRGMSDNTKFTIFNQVQNYFCNYNRGLQKLCGQV